MTEEFRIFVAWPDGTIAFATASPAVQEAYDLLAATKLGPGKAADLAVAAERLGQDPVAMANKMIRLGKYLREQH